MARARAIETRLEKLVPALDEYYASGFLTREETLEVSRQRTHWEYRLVAKPLLLLDVRGAITYELGLEKRLRDYCAHTKLNLQHRWDIVERIEGIYKIGLKHLKSKKEHEALRQEYVLFLKQFQRNGSLSNLYGELMVTYPRRSDIWVEAAEWQATSQHNSDNARAIVQQALLTMASEPSVWACALHVELQFVQRLLDGLLTEHREEARKTRKKAGERTAEAQREKEAEEDGLGFKKSAKGGDEEGGGGEADAQAAAAEPTSVIAPKLREENAQMGQVLLDLALAKTVVEEAFESPASGAVLMKQLLSKAGAFPFAKDVMELIVSTATHKMLEAWHASSDGESFAESAPPSVPVASLSIASQQQQLRVRVQWRHRQSIDAVLAAYLSLEDVLVNGYATAVVDTTTYLAEGGSDAIANAHRRQQKDGATRGVFSFANPAPEDRRRAAVKALVAIVAFASLPTSMAVAALPAGAVSFDDADSTQRFAAVRQAATDVLRRLVKSAPDAVSKVCTALLQGSFSSSSNETKTSAAKKSDRKKKASPSSSSLDVAEVVRWVLQLSELDTATQQSCVEEPRKRARALAEEISSAAGTAAPPRSRTRTEAADAATLASSPLITWSVVQLERFLQPADREALRNSASGAASPSPTSSAPLTTEEVERFLVWWKEEEAQLQQAPIVTASDMAASQARRRMAVVNLLQQHGLLPAIVTGTSAVSGASGGRKAAAERSGLTDTGAWAAAEAFLLNRSTALQYGANPICATGTTAAGDEGLPLSLWRLFSALETMLGPLNANAPTFTTDTKKDETSSSSSGSSSDDDNSEDEESKGDKGRSEGGLVGANASSSAAASVASARLPSFAAAGLYFLSGVPSSVLDHTLEWVRLEGVTSLLKCRLASWLGRRVCTRDDIAAVLRGATAEAAEGWVADLQSLLVVAQRCQPLPRYAQTHCILPFLEGVAVYRALSADASAVTVRGAMQAARDAHETLLRLYTVSTHPQSFLPLIYDGTPTRRLLNGEAAATTGKASTVAVQQANAEDWVAYVEFERAVAKDLLRAKTVVEQARRAALSPQQFMVKLNAL